LTRSTGSPGWIACGLGALISAMNASPSSAVAERSRKTSTSSVPLTVSLSPSVVCACGSKPERPLSKTLISESVLWPIRLTV
jgi:hypothetical protein